VESTHLGCLLFQDSRNMGAIKGVGQPTPERRGRILYAGLWPAVPIHAVYAAVDVLNNRPLPFCEERGVAVEPS